MEDAVVWGMKTIKIIDLIDLGLSNHQQPADVAVNLNCPVQIREIGPEGDSEFYTSRKHAARNFAVGPREFMAWHHVATTAKDGTVTTMTSATGGAGSCHVRPDRAVIIVQKANGGWVYVDLFVQGIVLDSVPMFKPGVVDAFLSELDQTARRIGAPAD